MRLLFSGGGTGGHVNPALAIAKYIKSRHPDAEIRFAGGEGGIETKLVPREGFELYTFRLHGLSRSFSGGGLKKNVSALGEAFKSVGEAKKILKSFQPDAVIGTGGYASFPVAYAAAQLRIPMAILEVNALAGVATKALARRADKIFISYEETALQLKTRGDVVLTGSPVREANVNASRSDARYKLGLMRDEQLVVSFWGSLGAREMNRKMIDFIKLECSEKPPFKHIHATGGYGYTWMPDELRKAGVRLEDEEQVDMREYIYDMEDVMAAADLVICRAGASTLAEVCVLGVPAIIAPSPYVAENHQEKNARSLERHGAARVILENECTGKEIYDLTVTLLSDRAKLAEMAQCARRLAKPNATAAIAEQIVQMAAR